VRISFRDHPAFQRAALAVIGAGGAAGVVVGLIDLPSGRWAVAGVTAAALAWSVIRDGTRPLARRAVAALAALASLAAALAAVQALAPGWLVGPPAFLDVLATPAVGVVAALGLLPLHLEVRLDPVGRALAAVRQGLGGEERALCERAAAAELRVREALATDRLPDARALRRLARALALGVLANARKVQLLAEAAAAVDTADITGRLDRLAEQRAAATDPGAVRQYQAAIAVLREQQAHLAAIAAAADRLRAHLHGQVALLEGTALALAARRGALAADAAAALGPLVERLRQVSSDARAEAAALTALEVV
jgi:hypothetical protein